MKGCRGFEAVIGEVNDELEAVVVFERIAGISFNFARCIYFCSRRHKGCHLLFGIKLAELGEPSERFWVAAEDESNGVLPEWFFEASWKLLFPFVVDPEPFMRSRFDASLKKIEYFKHLLFDIAMKFDGVAVVDDISTILPANGGYEDGAPCSFGEEGRQW